MWDDKHSRLPRSQGLAKPPCDMLVRAHKRTHSLRYCVKPENTQLALEVSALDERSVMKVESATPSMRCWQRAVEQAVAHPPDTDSLPKKLNLE